jgi:hypothetical protein
MSLGADATPQDVIRAECADREHSTIPIEQSTVDLATAYYGWKFPFGPAAGMPNGICDTSAVGTRKWTAYTDPVTGFTIQYPPTWAVVVNGAQTIFRDNPDDAYFPVEHREPAGPSALRAWQSLEVTFAEQHTGYQRVSLTGNDQTATWQYTYSDGTQTLEAIDYAFILGGGRRGFAFNYQDPASTFSSLQPTFQQIAATFRTRLAPRFSPPHPRHRRFPRGCARRAVSTGTPAASPSVRCRPLRGCCPGPARSRPGGSTIGLGRCGRYRRPHQGPDPLGAPCGWCSTCEHDIRH